ncbi:MAG TPA: acyl-CoA desaturase [Propionibacteriaceae bacterium]|nr:acyl-CoA desaturase [Propionibacteriaceae bacterium]
MTSTLIAPGTAGAEGLPTETRARSRSDFGPLRSRIQAERLLERRTGWYARKAGWMLIGLLVIVDGVLLLQNTWWALLLAPLAAVVSAQISFLGHDAGHQQISDSRRVNRWIGIMCANVLAGISFGWWQDKHLRHHANPNHEGLDPDVGEGIIAWSEEQAAKKSGFARWFARHQAAFFFPLLTFEGWNLHVAGLRALRARPAKARIWELGLIVLHFAVYFTFLFAFLTPVQAVLFVLIHQGLYGFNLGAAFAPNHKGMEMPPAGARLDHLRKQVLTSRDVTGGAVVDFFLGGLNYQIEHHLFPSMPRPNLKISQPIIRDYCESVGLPFRATGVIDSYGQCLTYMRKIGHSG